MDEVHEPQASPWVIFQQRLGGKEAVSDAVHHRAEVLHSHLHEVHKLPVDLLEILLSIGFQKVVR